jgi:hypothetical protein
MTNTLYAHMNKRNKMALGCSPLILRRQRSGGLRLKSAQANNLGDPILKKLIRSWWSGSRCRPGVQTPAWSKKKIMDLGGWKCFFLC